MAKKRTEQEKAEKERKDAEEKARKAKIILDRIRSGMSLIKATANNDPISDSTFDEWCAKDKELAGEYARAREQRADKIFEEILAIADDATNDTMVITGKDGTPIEVENKEWVNRSKLRIDARKWMLSKMEPKKYGDKMDVTTDGKAITAVINIS